MNISTDDFLITSFIELFLLLVAICIFIRCLFPALIYSAKKGWICKKWALNCSDRVVCSSFVSVFFILSVSISFWASDYSCQKNSCYIDVPMVEQENNLCGAASLTMVFKYWGKNISQYSVSDKIFNQSHKGILSNDLKSFSEKMGFLAFIYKSEINNIKENIKKGRPLIAAIRSQAPSGFHYVVIVGFDEELALIFVNDPYLGKMKSMNVQDFSEKWKEANYWTLLLLPKGD